MSVDPDGALFERLQAGDEGAFADLVRGLFGRGERERRTTLFASLVERELSDDAPAVAPERFLGADHARWPHHWATPPRQWEESESAETLARVREAIERLPPAQRVVITLRDMYGCESAEVCNALEVTETNQRVLLHRARSRVRADLESYFADD